MRALFSGLELWLSSALPHLCQFTSELSPAAVTLLDLKWSMRKLHTEFWSVFLRSTSLVLYIKSWPTWIAQNPDSSTSSAQWVPHALSAPSLCAIVQQLPLDVKMEGMWDEHYMPFSLKDCKHVIYYWWPLPHVFFPSFKFGFGTRMCLVNLSLENLHLLFLKCLKHWGKLEIQKWNSIKKH